MFSLRIMPAVNGYIVIYNEEEPLIAPGINEAVALLDELIKDRSIVTKWRENSINPETFGTSRCYPVDEEEQGHSESDVHVQPVLNGFIVTVGCKRVVFTDTAEMVKEIKAFFKSPSKVKEKYMDKSLNSHLWAKSDEEEVMARANTARRRVRRRN